MDPVERIILRHGHYEPEVWDALKAYAREGDTVWDVGSHIGGFALRAALTPGIRQVVCFEPAADTFEVLQSNAALNPHLPLVVFNMALSDAIGTHRLSNGTGENRGQRTLAHLQPGEAGTAIRCNTIDGMVASSQAEAPQLVKIDVEGWEAQVLKGGETLFRERPPRAVAFESSYEVRTNGGLRSPLEEFFRRHGYSVHHIPRPEGSIDLYENFLAAHGDDRRDAVVFH
jgi:FkbM family methyltransferase